MLWVLSDVQDMQSSHLGFIYRMTPVLQNVSKAALKMATYILDPQSNSIGLWWLLNNGSNDSKDNIYAGNFEQDFSTHITMYTCQDASFPIAPILGQSEAAAVYWVMTMYDYSYTFDWCHSGRDKKTAGIPLYFSTMHE